MNLRNGKKKMKLKIMTDIVSQPHKRLEFKKAAEEWIEYLEEIESGDSEYDFAYTKENRDGVIGFIEHFFK